MARAADPTREVALIALTPCVHDNAKLREVIVYAFDQLCWSMGDAELVAFILTLAEGDLRIALGRELGGA